MLFGESTGASSTTTFGEGGENKLADEEQIQAFCKGRLIKRHKFQRGSWGPSVSDCLVDKITVKSNCKSEQHKPLTC